LRCGNDTTIRRCAYRFSVESTIYLDPQRVGRGYGKALYEKLINAIRDLSMRTVLGGIALPNHSSIALHEKLGFRKIAHFEQVGFKQNRWVDVGYWQLLL
jgi:L-amino acid N-acyltransferase YncA